MNSFIIPPSLKVGDKVGIISPSDFVEERDLVKSISIIKSWGLEVVLGDHLFDQEQGFAAGSPEDRYKDLRRMVFDDEIKMIWCSSGGFATTQLWPLIEKDFIDKLKVNPKVIIGYSDICILSHLWFSNGLCSIHGPNLSGLSDLNEESISWTKKMIFGDIKVGDLLISDGVCVREGRGTGRLLCSNLDSLVACFGTNYDPLDITDDIILGIEEFEQFKSDIQRQIDMIMNHKNSGRIKGIILGKFRDLKFDEEYSDWYLKNETWEIIAKRVAAVSTTVPVTTWSNFGHVGDNFIAFKNGVRVELISNSDKSTLTLI